MGGNSRFYAVHLCCAEVFILECLCGRTSSDFKVLRKFKLPLEELHLWRPKHPIYVCLPSNMFFLKQVELICPDKDSYRLAVSYEYTKNVPFPLHTVYWTFDVLNDNEEIFKPAIILGIRIDVVEKWLQKVPAPLDKTVAVAPYIFCIYNILNYLDLEQNLRQENKISLVLYCNSYCTDLIIIGQNSSHDLFRTFTRTYGNVSLIWDIKETLEMYFGRYSTRVGDIPMTKDINKVFFIRSGELEEQKDWESLFAEQVGVSLELFPFEDIMSTFFPKEETAPFEKAAGYCIALGLAFMCVSRHVNGLKSLIFLEHKKAPVSFSNSALWLQSGLVLGGWLVIGNFYLNAYLPLLHRQKQISSMISSYNKIKREAKRLEKEKKNLTGDILHIANEIQAQYKLAEIIKCLSMSMANLDGIKIDEFTEKILPEAMNQISVSIKLSAKDYDILNEFIRNLRQTKKFNKVSPVTSHFDEAKQEVEMLLILEMECD